MFNESLQETDWAFRKNHIYFAGVHFEANSQPIRKKGNVTSIMTALIMFGIVCLVVWIARASTLPPGPEAWVQSHVSLGQDSVPVAVWAEVSWVAWPVDSASWHRLRSFRGTLFLPPPSPGRSRGNLAPTLPRQGHQPALAPNQAPLAAHLGHDAGDQGGICHGWRLSDRGQDYTPGVLNGIELGSASSLWHGLSMPRSRKRAQA
jgi:hypothetical protein